MKKYLNFLTKTKAKAFTLIEMNDSKICYTFH